MSFREKSAWITLTLYLLVYGYYGWTLYSVAQAGQTATYDYVWLLVRLVFLLVVLQVVFSIAITVVTAVTRPSDIRKVEDEREKLIALKATRYGFAVLAIGALAICLWIAYGGREFYTANTLFLVVVLAEMSRSAAQIVYFRKGT
ncbi:MAG: hypothetical protein HY243_05375 [Proteobacteria bacterium]|nr:hypothetical protein [Pseudomonadota bacterium]